MKQIFVKIRNVLTVELAKDISAMSRSIWERTRDCWVGVKWRKPSNRRSRPKNCKCRGQTQIKLIFFHKKLSTSLWKLQGTSSKLWILLIVITKSFYRQGRSTKWKKSPENSCCVTMAKGKSKPVDF